jgi:antitoxin component YwqK of YwqJK toxin-antitoxin module
MRYIFHLTLFTLLSISIVSCNQETKQAAQTETGDQNKLVKKKRKDGTLSSINPLDEEGYVHGVKVNFYDDGLSVHSKVTYEHGRKHGPAIWFFKNGKIYEYSTYYQNRKHGVTKRYYETGELYEELSYDTGEEMPGKKRYTKEGELITK